MKKLLLLTLVSLLAVPISAQQYLTITQKDGQQFSFGFSDNPVVTYEGSDLILTTAKTVIQYPLESLLNFTFTDQTTSVQTLEGAAATVSKSENFVTIMGAKPETAVNLIGTDGKVLFSKKSDADGVVSFSIADLPDGIYIVKSESLNCKIVKK